MARVRGYAVQVNGAQRPAATRRTGGGGDQTPRRASQGARRTTATAPGPIDYNNRGGRY